MTKTNLNNAEMEDLTQTAVKLPDTCVKASLTEVQCHDLHA